MLGGFGGLLVAIFWPLFSLYHCKVLAWAKTLARSFCRPFSYCLPCPDIFSAGD
jgi:hypothetical protein